MIIPGEIATNYQNTQANNSNPTKCKQNTYFSTNAFTKSIDRNSKQLQKCHSAADKENLSQFLNLLLNRNSL